MSERDYELISSLPPAVEPLTGEELVEFEQDGVSVKGALSILGGTPGPHGPSHKIGGTDNIATQSRAANAIPATDGAGTLDVFVSLGTTEVKGLLQLATDNESSATKPMKSNDPRATNARTPTPHALSHKGGTDDLGLGDAAYLNRGFANGVASLDADAKIPTAQLPDLAINETFTVDSEIEMLALTAQRGDVAIRTDEDPDGMYLLTADDPTTLSNWKFVSAGGKVSSVNGQAGAVSLDTDDISEGDNKYVSANEKAAIGGTYGTPSSANKFVTETDPTFENIPSDDEYAAITGANTPSAANVFATMTDLSSATAPYYTADVTVTVGTGGDYASINAALAVITRKYPSQKTGGGTTRVTISQLTGFVMAEQVFVDGIDLSHITISSVDAEVTVTRSALTINSGSTHPIFSAKNGAVLPVINTLYSVDSSGSSTDKCGIELLYSSKVIVFPNKGIRNNLAYGISVGFNSNAFINAANFSGCSIGIKAVYGCVVYASSANASGASSYGVSIDASYCDLTSANFRKGASNSTTDLAIGNGSYINIKGATGGYPIATGWITENGILYNGIADDGVYNPTGTNATNCGVVQTHTTSYIKKGTHVSVWGYVSVTATASGSGGQFIISLPISSDFTALSDCNGTAASDSTSTHFAIFADSSNNQARFYAYNMQDTSNHDYSFLLEYTIK